MSTVHVKNIAHNTSEREVRDFFSFCGKITSLSVTPASEAADSPQSASVTFEKETAAKTALLLDNTQLGPSQVSVSSAAGLSDLASGAASSDSHDKDHPDSEIHQEDKPRSRIAAEYLAHGYTLSDSVLQKAIALDNKHGVSNRFTAALQNFDAKYKASDRARGLDQSYGVTDKVRGLDQSYGVSDKVGAGWRGINSYFEKALGTPTGQKLVAFYEQGNKQVVDIHNEARRLADLKAGKSSAGPASAADASVLKEKNEKTLETVPGTEKTTCQCQGESGTCPCEEGHCACVGCGKSGVKGDGSATGQGDVVAATSGVQPLGEKTA